MTRRVCALGYDSSSGPLYIYIMTDGVCCVCVVYCAYLYVYLLEPHPDRRARTGELQMRAVACTTNTFVQPVQPVGPHLRDCWRDPPVTDIPDVVVGRHRLG